MYFKARLLLKWDVSNITHIAQTNIAIFKSLWLFEFIFVNSIKYQGQDAWTLWKGINGPEKLSSISALLSI